MELQQKKLLISALQHIYAAQDLMQQGYHELAAHKLKKAEGLMDEALNGDNQIQSAA